MAHGWAATFIFVLSFSTFLSHLHRSWLKRKRSCLGLVWVFWGISKQWRDGGENVRYQGGKRWGGERQAWVDEMDGINVAWVLGKVRGTSGLSVLIASCLSRFTAKWGNVIACIEDILEYSELLAFFFLLTLSSKKWTLICFSRMKYNGHPDSI